MRGHDRAPDTATRAAFRTVTAAAVAAVLALCSCERSTDRPDGESGRPPSGQTHTQQLGRSSYDVPGCGAPESAIQPSQPTPNDTETPGEESR